MKKFTSIESFSSVYHRVRYFLDANPGSSSKLTFTGTVKLHGSNCSIRRSNEGNIITQSRQRVLTIDYDNYGFAEYVSQLPQIVLDKLFSKFEKLDDVVIYGELIGKGIQKKAGVCSLPGRQWVVFAVTVNDKYQKISDYKDLTFNEYGIYNILQGPLFKVMVDFNDPKDAVDTINSLTLDVESKCPWSSKFDLDGVGEGIVWICEERPGDSGLFFKSKGDAHKVSKMESAPAVLSPEVASSLDELIESVVTDNRLEQGMEYLSEMGLTVELKNMGTFLKWVNLDILKEDKVAIESSDLEWKLVSKHITSKATQFFKNKCNQLLDF